MTDSAEPIPIHTPKFGTLKDKIPLFDARSNQKSSYRSWVDEEISQISAKHNIFGVALEKILKLVRKVAEEARNNRISENDISKSANGLEKQDSQTSGEVPALQCFCFLFLFHLYSVLHL